MVYNIIIIAFWWIICTILYHYTTIVNRTSNLPREDIVTLCSPVWWWLSQVTVAPWSSYWKLDNVMVEWLVDVCRSYVVTRELLLAKVRAGTRVWSGKPSKPAVVHNAPYAVHVRRSVNHCAAHTLTSPTGVRTTTQEEPKVNYATHC